MVTPPHVGDPRDPSQLSPYLCNSLELCQRFGTSPERIAILNGLLQLRAITTGAGFNDGFQWVAGSFIEDIERRETRSPNDVDVVTCYHGIPLPQQAAFIAANPILADRDLTKQNYRVDHFFVDIAYAPLLTVELVRYWIGLFSHRRDEIWKGMLRLELNTPTEDAAAVLHLQTVSAGMP